MMHKNQLNSTFNRIFSFGKRKSLISVANNRIYNSSWGFKITEPKGWLSLRARSLIGQLNGYKSYAFNIKGGTEL